MTAPADDRLATARRRHARAVEVWRAADAATFGRNDQRAKAVERAARQMARDLRAEVARLELADRRG